MSTTVPRSATLVPRTFSTARHTTRYLESGPADGPLMIFLHGWPSVGLIWRAQLEAFAAEGWHCVAPDLRGFGGVYRSGRPDAVGRVAPTATTTRDGGRFGAAHRAPVTTPAAALWPAPDFDVLVDTFATHGFRASCAWYANDDANIAYAREAPDEGRVAQPVLFVNGDWDVICSIDDNRQGDPMRAACADLTVVNVPAGQWLPLGRPAEHVEAVQAWLPSRGL